MKAFINRLAISEIILASVALQIAVSSASALEEKPLLFPVDAVDVHGKRYHARDYHGGKEPWFEDQIKAIGPRYPASERARHHEGEGVFHLTLDLKTGSVIDVRVAKSTGYDGLDRAAVAVLRQWRWRPGKWRQIDEPIVFRTGEPLPRPGIPVPLE